MSISQVRATYGLRAVGTPTSPASAGTLNLGISPTSVNLTDADVFYAIQALVVGSSSDLVIALATGSKSGSTAWTAGTAQVETTTIVAGSGTTSDGNLALVLTTAGMTGSPLTINVPLTTATHTTAALIAQACVDTINANATASAIWTATRSTADIILTRKPSTTYTVGGVSVPVYPANDATANLAIPTARGVTGDATSTDTTAGVASAGCYVVGDAQDFEGNALASIAASRLGAFVLRNEDESLAEIAVGGSIYNNLISAGSELIFICDSANGFVDTLTIEPASTALVTIVVAGSSI